MKYEFLISAAIAAMLIGCKPDTPIDPEPPEVKTVYAYGADVSWYSQQAAEGVKFYDASGAQTECIPLMKKLGLDAIRLRVFVNPKASGGYSAQGWCGKDDFIAKAKAANAAGMRLMVDFHYSDNWADPAKQYKPSSWASLSGTQLQNAVMEHTADILNALKSAGITPEWVQVGNEVTNGMIWPDGKIENNNFTNFVQLFNAGYASVKNVFPDAKVILHIDNGYDAARFKWFFDGMKAAGCKYDVIGMSIFPSYVLEGGKEVPISTTVSKMLNNINTCISAYGKPVMICEAGMPWDRAAECRQFLSSLINGTKDNKNVLGLFYWEPQQNPNVWGDYTLGAFDSGSRATEAFDAFKR